MVTYITDKDADKKINSKGIVILDVYADWCGPCRLLAPVMEKLGKIKHFNILKINADENKITINKYSVTSLPTILFFIDGKLKDKHIGYAPLEFIENKGNNL